MTASNTVAQQLQALPSNARFSDEELDVVYAMAFHALTQAQYLQALRYFAFLTLYRPTGVDYLAGLALSQQHLHQYTAAIGTNTLLELLYPATAAAAAASLRVAECQLAQEHRDAARLTLELSVTAYAEVAGAAPSLARASALLELISNTAAA